MTELPEADKYMEAVFLQKIRAKAKRTFGCGLSVTVDEVEEIFWSQNPELLESLEPRGQLDEAKQMFRDRFLESLTINVEENGIKVVRA